MGKSFSIFNENSIIFDFTKHRVSNELEIINSDLFHYIWSEYCDNVSKSKDSLADLLTLVDNPKDDFIPIFKLLLAFEYDEILKDYPVYASILNRREDFYLLIENLYNYWRSFKRYSLLDDDNIDNNTFLDISNSFGDLVLKTYRSITQKIQNKNFAIYRQLPAGANVSLLVTNIKWSNIPLYNKFNDVKYLDKIVIKPPLIAYTKQNTRTGTFKELDKNPLDGLEFDSSKYMAYIARVGSSLAYVYFHLDYLIHGLCLSNLFEFVSPKGCVNVKPDIVLVFGAEIEGESSFYIDKANDIYVGYTPHDDSIDYFGYMKKMLLTLHNVRMISNGYLPIHGSGVNITFKDGTNKTLVLMGDSGAGKSETLEAIKAKASNDIASIKTIFDDMGTFMIKDGSIYAYGTEIGAFVRIDDMDQNYAYQEMDRAIFINTNRVNARLIIPVATYKSIMKGYKVDAFLYANNYEDNPKDIVLYDKLDAVKDIFVKAKRGAKGTTSEKGIVCSFFANPFGPVQKEKETTALINKYFDLLYKNKVMVGEIYTRLFIEGYEQKGPQMVAPKLYSLLRND